MKFRPQPGVLLISPIEDPSEKSFLEIVGQKANLSPCVIEAVGDSVPPHLTPGTVVYLLPTDCRSVALDQGVLYFALYHTQTLGSIPANEAGEVIRKNMTATALKARADAATAKASISVNSGGVSLN